jgi:hypothetical protein
MAKNETLTIEQLQQQVAALKQQHGEVMPVLAAQRHREAIGRGAAATASGAKTAGRYLKTLIMGAPKSDAERMAELMKELEELKKLEQ